MKDRGMSVAPMHIVLFVCQKKKEEICYMMHEKIFNNKINVIIIMLLVEMHL